MIRREMYLERLRAWKDKNVIKVITGVRRCGKSTLMEQWRDELLAAGVDERHIVHINLEMLENEELLDYRVLHSQIISQCQDAGMHYVLLDEVQAVNEFQKAIDSLYVRPNIDLYITGSNATLLSGTLATLLSGRYVEIGMAPLSFAEFRSDEARREVSLNRCWSDYIHDGAFPAVGEVSHDESLTFDYLDGIFNTILIKDVVQRAGGDAALLRRLTGYIYDNIGNLMSPASISRALTAAGTKVSAPTVSKYLEVLESAFLIYTADRFDLRGKRILKQEKKYYAVDMGLRRIVCSNAVRDTGRILENVVYLELLRRERNVYVGQGASGEIDFVTNGPEGIKYWQVSESVSNKATLDRELSSFASVRDNYPKMLLTMDDAREESYGGIRRVYVLDWLLNAS